MNPEIESPKIELTTSSHVSATVVNLMLSDVLTTLHISPFTILSHGLLNYGYAV